MTVHPPQLSRLLSAVATLWALGLLCLAASTTALLLSPTERVEVRLSDGTPVVLHRAAESVGDYYYLPTNPRLATADDGAPEFLLWKFITDADAGAGGVSGAVLHLQMTWGLDAAQEREAARKLNLQRPGATLEGPAPIAAPGEGSTFRVVSATLGEDAPEARVVVAGTAPHLPGGRAAVAARLGDHGAQTLLSTLEGDAALGDLSLVLDFSYHTEWPAARGEILVDWTRLDREGDSLQRSYGRRCLLHLCTRPTITDSSELRRQVQHLTRQGVISFRWDEDLPDERLAEIEDAFFERFLEIVAEVSTDATELPIPNARERLSHPGLLYGRLFSLRKRPSRRRGVQRIPLDVRLPVTRRHQLIANLKDWYDDARNCSGCVAEVRLDDPFYETRAVPFILGVDGEAIFDDAIHHVKVTLRRQRSVGRDYKDSKTIDRDYLRREGAVAQLTYARAEGGDPDAFEYQVEWSLKGGGLFPRSPDWRTGTWEGVVLEAPIEARTVEFEADLEDMESRGFTRATVEVRYWLFDHEASETLRLRLRGSPYLEKRLFMDRGARGFAYRLVLQHRVEGALALPWESQVNSDYIFAAIPPELLEGDDALARAKAAAQEALRADETGVLDQFPELKAPESS